MDQVFNELSLSASLPDSYAARDALLNLKKASEQLTVLGLSRQIRVTEDFAVRLIMPDCTVRDYLKSPASGQDKTLRQWLLSRFSSAPYVEQLCTDLGMTSLEEYSIDEQICKGLALAALWSMPALSLAGDAHFVSPFVTLTYSWLAEASTDIQEEKCRVGIICQEADIQFHEAAIQTLLRGSVNTGEELLNDAQQRLTSLNFSSTAIEQLMAMQRGDPLLPRIRRILEELHYAMLEAVTVKSRFAPKSFKYTPAEGENATQGKKGEKHTFTFVEQNAQGPPTKISLLCEAHMRITGSKRIYFYADRSKTTVYIGHIGEHLPGKNVG